MKIAHIIFCLSTGGAETMLIDIINQQSKDNEISLIVINKNYSIDLVNKVNNNINIYLINRQEGSLNPYYYIKFNIILTKIKPDIIHCHNSNIAPLIINHKTKKLYLTVHDTMQDIKYYEYYHKIFAISKAVKEHINSIKFFPNIQIIPNGIPIEQIKSREHTKELNRLKIIQDSRLYTEYKGQDILIRAIKQIVTEGITNIKIDFIGDGDSKQELLKLTKDLQLERYVNFLGLKDRNYIYNHLKDYDLFVQPSIYEGFGLTVAEAMAAKLPVLVSNIEGPMEIIGQGKYGSFFHVKDSKACAAKIKEIFNSYQKYQDIAETISFQHVITNYSINLTAKRYLKEYEK